MTQPTVSRQLAPLRELGLVDQRREGTWVFYSPGDAMSEQGMLSVLRAGFANMPTFNDDIAGVKRVLEARRERSKKFFNERAGFYGHGKEPGGGYEAIATAFSLALDGKDVIDLGCGEGGLALLMARGGANVTAVDSAPNMVDYLSNRAAQDKLRNLKVLLGDFESVPLPDASADFIIISQALHHAARPAGAIVEAARLARPGGRVVILDLERHDREEMRFEYGDLWLGFNAEEVKAMMGEAKLVEVSVKTIGTKEPPNVLFAVGTKALA